MSSHAVICAAMAVTVAGCTLVPNTPGWERRVERNLQIIEKNQTALVEAGFDSPTGRRLARANMNRIGSIIGMLNRDESPQLWKEPLDAGRYVLTFDPEGAEGRPYWAPSRFDSVSVAKPPDVTGEASVLARSGIGAPVILERNTPAGGGDTDPLFPPNGIAIPATAIVRFDRSGDDAGRPVTARMQFVNPEETTQVSVDGRPFQVASNFNAALDEQLGSRVFGRISLFGLLNPEKYRGEMGLYSVEVYDPNKIPLVLVHGLYSDPHIWMNLMRACISDPVLRKEYQVWYFIYPTGLPVTGSARALRESLLTLRLHYDPEGTDRAFDNMVIVGHSMGGLVARMQAIDSGPAFYDAHFTVPVDRLSVSATQRQTIRESLYFKKVPFVQRLIFIATPHRGSDIADLSIARLFEYLIKIPRTALSLSRRLLTLDVAYLNPQLTKFRDLGLTSVQNLSPRHPFFDALHAVEIQVPYHSIIGDRGHSGPLAESSDGVVRYTSSHLDGAESEEIVPRPHGCVESPEVVAEVVRILHLHLQSRR